MPNGRDPEKDRNFWLWVERTYRPEQVGAIQRDASVLGVVWEHYATRIYGTQWDVGYEPLPPSRPQPEKYGLSETDWLTLEMLGGNPARVQRELERWIGTGYINQYQARDIWGELDVRLRQARTTLLATGYTEEEWPAEYERRQAEKARLKEQAYYQKLARAGQFFAPRQLRQEPFREYGPALEKMRGEFAEEMPKTERWRDWFRSKYPRMIEQFEAKPEAERIGKKTWVEYLKKRKPEIREEWWRRTPFERGERPTAFAPRIQTVGF